MTISNIHENIYNGKICPYCLETPAYVNSSIIYGKDYGMIYYCSKCQAYVGVHKGTDKPKGRLANAELREWKKEAHKYFDMLWQHKIMNRNEAYQWLSEALDIPKHYTHIGMFSVRTCQLVVEHSKRLLNDNRRLDLDFGVTPATPYYEL